MQNYKELIDSLRSSKYDPYFFSFGIHRKEYKPEYIKRFAERIQARNPSHKNPANHQEHAYFMGTFIGDILFSTLDGMYATAGGQKVRVQWDYDTENPLYVSLRVSIPKEGEYLVRPYLSVYKFVQDPSRGLITKFELIKSYGVSKYIFEQVHELDVDELIRLLQKYAAVSA